MKLHAIADAIRAELLIRQENSDLTPILFRKKRGKGWDTLTGLSCRINRRIATSERNERSYSFAVWSTAKL
jgi:hypothetical protein